MKPVRGASHFVLVIGLGLLVVACSGSSTSGSPAATTGSPAASTEASTEPTGAPAASATSDDSASSNWVAFREKILPFTSTFTTDVQAMTQQLIDGDKAGASATAAKLHDQIAEYLAWLDANPPDACYQPSWDLLHAALEDALAGTEAYAAGDFEGGSDDLMSGGSEMIDAGSTIQDSGDRCRS
jgi:hypothetical protein